MAFFIDKINPNATTRNGYWNLRYRRGFVFYGKEPFTIQITSYQFVYSFVEGQPVKDTLRKTNVTFEKTGIKTDSSIQETLGSTSQTIH